MSTPSELDSVDAFMAWVAERHPGESEFQQAVCEVAEHVLDLARDHSDYASSRVLQRLTEPDRTISFRVVWEDDDGLVQINRGYRVQHSNAIGPYKGGIRFAADISPSVLKFLAFEQTFKNSLTGLNLGAGKGGADFDPRGRSDREVMRFCHAFMTELHHHIGPETDVPAGDIGVGAREIGYLFGQYKRLQNEFAGALTGKPLAFGGSELRTEATGYGAVYFLRLMLQEEGEALEGKRVAISGAGNVALYAAQKAIASGASVITLSDSEGYASFNDGLSGSDHERLIEERGNGRRLAEVVETVGGRYHEGARPWTEEVDIAIPSATQNELDEEDAQQLVDQGCRVVVEGANMPLTTSARSVFGEAGVAVAPSKAANAGGVAISGLEMEQNRLGRSWPIDRLDRELEQLMGSIFEQAKEAGSDSDRVNYGRGADRAGFTRVADALVSFGYV